MRANKLLGARCAGAPRARRSTAPGARTAALQRARRRASAPLRSPRRDQPGKSAEDSQTNAVQRPRGGTMPLDDAARAQIERAGALIELGREEQAVELLATVPSPTRKRSSA